MPEFLGLDYIIFTIMDYPMSLMEFVGTIAGLIAVWLASRNNIFTWAFSLVNVAAFFFIFYQIHLYSDMGLQVYFFVTAIVGWIYWSKQDGTPRKIQTLHTSKRLLTTALLIAGTAGIGLLAKNLHLLFPEVFTAPAAYPFWDAFTTTASIIANLLLALRILESWVLWIAVDIVSTVLYWDKGVLFISFQFFIFLLMASYGLWVWIKKYEKEKLERSTAEFKP